MDRTDATEERVKAEMEERVNKRVGQERLDGEHV